MQCPQEKYSRTVEVCQRANNAFWSSSFVTIDMTVVMIQKKVEKVLCEIGQAYSITNTKRITNLNAGERLELKGQLRRESSIQLKQGMT